MSFTEQMTGGLRRLLRQNRTVRRLVMRYFPNQVGTSMTDRILIRIAVVSSLCERLASSEYTSIVQVSDASPA